MIHLMIHLRLKTCGNCSHPELGAEDLSDKTKPKREQMKESSMAGAKGFEPPAYSLGGCRPILARPRAHCDTPEIQGCDSSLLRLHFRRGMHNTSHNIYI